MTIDALRTDIRIRGALAGLLAICLFVQSLMPLGWMPSTSGSFLQLCAASGPVNLAQGPDNQASRNAEHRLAYVCPFAGAGLWTKTEFDAIGALPARVAFLIAIPVGAPASKRVADLGPPLGSRAPPRA